MLRIRQLTFAASLLALCWFAMMAVHEFGHVIGALCTGGTVQRVVLYPLTISRTDVAPSPHPAIVVWLGPLLGCVLPLAALAVIPSRFAVLRSVMRLFAGFCLIADGAYISMGVFSGVGDCGEMLRTGTPLWTMLAFGALTIPLGLYLWHGLGSPSRFFSNPSLVTPTMACVAVSALLIFIATEFVFSPC